MIRDLLILGDFRGSAVRAGESLARRKLWRVDRDDIDVVLAAMRPEATITLDPDGPPLTIRFESLDDFHPDRLVERVPLLRQLRALRAELAAPGRVSPPPREAVRASTDAAATAMSGGSLLDRILDDTPGGLVAPSDELSDFVNRAVRPHLMGEVGPDQRDEIAKVDATITAALRVILHDRSFQSLEALWRGIDLITRRVNTSEDLHITLADVTREDLVSALAADVGLRSMLETPFAGGGGSRWSVAFIAHDFGETDIPVLASLAQVASDAGVACIAGARPSFAGAESFGDGSDVDTWDKTPAPGWDVLRRSDTARWLGLALPRFLIRVSYGVDNPCEVVPFEELDTDQAAHEGFLWANAALLCAVMLGESIAEADEWATHGTIERMPVQLLRVNDESVIVPGAEAMLSQRSMAHLLDRGLIPLLSSREGGAVRVPRLQSVAYPPSPLSIEGRS